MAAVYIEIEGMEELLAAMKRLEPAVVRKVWRKSLRAGAKVIANAAKSKCPVAKKTTPWMKQKGYKRGDLKRSIKVRSGKGGAKRVRFVVITGQDENLHSGDQYYGGFIEFGTSRMAPKPFLRPAFDENKDQVAKTVIDESWSVIKQEWAK